MIDALAGEVGGSAARLRGLGLLDPYVDLSRPGADGAGRQSTGRRAIEPLSDRERAALATVGARAAVHRLGRRSGDRPRDRNSICS